MYVWSDRRPLPEKCVFFKVKLLFSINCIGTVHMFIKCSVTSKS